MFEFIGVVGLFLVLLGIAWCGDKLYWRARANLRNLVDTEDDLKEIGNAWEAKSQSEMSDEEFYARAQAESNLEKYKKAEINTDTFFPASEFPDQNIFFDTLKAHDPHVMTVEAVVEKYSGACGWRIGNKQQVGLMEVHAIQAAAREEEKCKQLERDKQTAEFEKRERLMEECLTPKEREEREERRKTYEALREQQLALEELKRKLENSDRMQKLYADKDDMALLSCVKYFSQHLDESNPHLVAAVAEVERRYPSEKKVMCQDLVDAVHKLDDQKFVTELNDLADKLKGFKAETQLRELASDIASTTLSNDGWYCTTTQNREVETKVKGKKSKVKTKKTKTKAKAKAKTKKESRA